MISWLLDTNAVITLVARLCNVLLQRIESLEPGSLAISAIVAHELYYGACRSQRVEFNLETLRFLFADLAILISIARTRGLQEKSGRSWGARHSDRSL